MNVKEMAQRSGLEFAGSYMGEDEAVQGGIYTCDLLSLVMGQAPGESVWLTVMGNVNSIAVASLAGVACIVLCHNVPLDDEARQKADDRQIAVLKSSAPVFDTALKIKSVLDGAL